MLYMFPNHYRIKLETIILVELWIVSSLTASSEYWIPLNCVHDSALYGQREDVQTECSEFLDVYR